MDNPNTPKTPETEIPEATPNPYRRSASSIKVNCYEDEISDTTKKLFKDLQYNSQTIGDFMKAMTMVGKRTGSVSSVKFIKLSDHEYNLNFSRPNVLSVNTYSRGTNLKARVFGLIDYFDIASAGVLFKITAVQSLTAPKKFHTVFNYTVPFQIHDDRKIFRLSFFNMNTYQLRNWHSAYQSSVLGAQLGTLRYGSFSAYTKLYPISGEEKSISRDKLILRYFNPHLFVRNFAMDLKVSMDRDKQVNGQVLFYKDKNKYFHYHKALCFIGNSSLIGFSTSKSLSAQSNQRIYDFGNSGYKGSNIFSVYSRLGVMNKVGPLIYATYLFHSLMGHKDGRQMNTSVSYGVGNRLLLSNTLSLELLLNFSKDQNQARLTTKVLYYD
jgi:hypothetical protein